MLRIVLFTMIILWVNGAFFSSISIAETPSNFKENSAPSTGIEAPTDAVVKTISHTLVMDTYAHMIVDLPSIQLKDIESIDAPLTQKILKGYEETRGYATFWLHDIQDQMVTVNEDILHYNTVFQRYYTNLIKYLDENDKVNFSKEVNQLYQNSLTHEKNVENLLERLKQYRKNISDHSQNLKSDTVPFLAIATSLNNDIPFLKQQIETQQAIIKKYQDQIRQGEFLEKILLGCIGTSIIMDAEDNIKIAEQTIHDLKIKMYGVQWEVSQIIDATASIIYMAETLDMTIDAVQNLCNYWGTITAKYRVMLNNVNTMNDTNALFIKEDLSVTKESWEGIQNFANQLQDIKILPQ